MHWGNVLAIIGGILLVGFIVFAFGQGMKVKPTRYNRSDNDLPTLPGPDA